MMKRNLFVAAFALLAFSSCRSDKEADLSVRALELCAYIPDHGLPEDADKNLTESYLRAYTEAMAIPEWVEYAGEIGSKEFLFYFVSGNGDGTPAFTVTEIRKLDEVTAEADVTVHLAGTTGPEGERKATMTLVQRDGKWLLDDFDGTKGRCQEFIRSIRSELRSGAALDSLRHSGWEEEDYIQHFEDDVEQFYAEFGREESAVFSVSSIPPRIESRMRGVSFPEDAEIKMDDLRYLKLSYIDFDGNSQVGEMVCNKAVAAEILSIFEELYQARYPIRSIRLVDDFGGDDEASMAADNTSCFNYRKKTGMRSLSKHAQGLAVDINPLENPYVRSSEVRPAVAAAYADREKDFPHKIDKNDLCYKLFLKHGFSWGGAWRSVKDYQHFEK